MKFKTVKKLPFQMKLILMASGSLKQMEHAFKMETVSYTNGL
ncbi:hypothetical protein M124_2616 [Bacteroides fragilis str. 3988T(B)14]|uniref:Uncharacterized protein n=1 Tax=Bacteroides fragilis str. 3988T(B)14 TaxID=1339315 RepID=A0A015TS47_BACFG|nr:hypothetical protein M124_2616 [Bacteroides fragilis str. 3988T(B)14]